MSKFLGFVVVVLMVALCAWGLTQPTGAELVALEYLLGGTVGLGLMMVSCFALHDRQTAKYFLFMLLWMGAALCAVYAAQDVVTNELGQKALWVTTGLLLAKAFANGRRFFMERARDIEAAMDGPGGITSDKDE